MPATEEIDPMLIREHINRAVSEVFKTMLGYEPRLNPLGEHVHPPGAPPTRGRPQVVGTVGFIGQINGMMYLHFDLAFARQCTGNLIGLTGAELDIAGDEVINDAIGELTNMTVGSFKNALCDAGFPCKLTIPSILRGTNFSIEPISSAVRHVFHFDCGDHQMIADILMKSGD